MGKVYIVDSIYHMVYLNTKREALSSRPGGEQPESVDVRDAAEECNRLLNDLGDAEKTINALRMLLLELFEVCPDDVIETTGAGNRAKKFLEENPLPPATASDRDGQRSYGI